MTYLDAAFQVLSLAGQPLHYSEIAQRALIQGLIQPTGLTPDATMGSRLYSDTQEENSRFARAGKGMFELTKPKHGGIDEQIQQINQRTEQELHKRLLSMPAKRFESLITELLFKMGFEESTLQVTPYSGDGGIDVVGRYRAAGLTDVNAAVQAKRWKSNVQAPTVTQLRGSLQVHQQGIIITTSDFSSGARKEAIAPGKTRISLINGEELVKMLIKYGVSVKEKKYDVYTVDEEWWGDVLAVSSTADTSGKGLVPTPVISEPVAASSIQVVTADIPQQGLFGADTNTLDAPSLTAATTPAPLSGLPFDPTGQKPIAITLLGERQIVGSWRDVLVAVCTGLVQVHGDAFENVAVKSLGLKQHYLSHSSDAMASPVLVPGTTLYIDTTQNAKSIVRLVYRLLTSLGHQEDALSVERSGT